MRRVKRFGMAVWDFNGTACMIQHPTYGRMYRRINDEVRALVFDDVWIPDDAHPLGGRDGSVVLHRRVNLKKDRLHTWVVLRPLYEFVRRTP